jgi:hypothetical protein
VEGGGKFITVYLIIWTQGKQRKNRVKSHTSDMCDNNENLEERERYIGFPPANFCL